MSFPSDVIEISDSDDDACPPPPTSSQFSQRSFSSDLVDLCSSDDELPAPGDPKFFRGLGQAKRKRSSLAAGSSKSSGGYIGESSDEEDQYESPKKITRRASSTSMKPTYGDASSEGEDEDSPPKKKKPNSSSVKAPRKPHKTGEEKAAAKALKQQEAAEKKAQKAAEKAAKAEEAAIDKEAKKEYKSANKLVNDKKSTLKDMEIIFPPVSTPALQKLRQAFGEEVGQYKMTVSVSGRQSVPGYDVFSWRRNVTAEYDPIKREWQPVEPHTKFEETYLVYMPSDELARCIRDEDGVKNVVRSVRAKYGRVQIFLMIDGLTAYLRRSGGIRYTKEQIERKLSALQMAEHTHLLYVDKIEDAVARLYDLSADLGIKPHKLIERSHLPFCSNTRQTTGANLADTWQKMIKQVHRMTESGAQGIVEVFPTANMLFEAYEAAHPAARDGMVADCMIKHRVDGVANPRKVNGALSKVVGTVMFGEDPLTLAYKANA
ncbi:hypothetical protein DFH07DRAFT_946470 [Mycena maculata]|uniref:ERCC4 domain-containing protein n=1 Tax=Mycena maculata TaxID=230809 RepID=A0AAD7HM44_9AGAR|nr:hypothetical protein DFH07DRAFT_946470 [Mycena maculata]